MKAYYKTSAPEVLAAWNGVSEQRTQMRAEGDAFAAEWGGTALYTYSHHGEDFAGLKFRPVKDRMLWTVPMRASHEAQAPRTKPRAGASTEQRTQHAELRDKWKADYPKRKVSYDELLASMGTDWGAVLFGGIGWFEHDGCLFVVAGTPLNDRMVEIMASEYAAASKAVKA